MGIRKSSTARKSEIVAATLSLVAELGPGGVSTQAVADRVGITQAGVFRHFSTKQDLWLAVAEWLITEAKKRWEEACKTEVSAFEKIKKVIGAHLEFVQHTPALHSLIFSRELHAQNDLLRQAFNSMASDFNNLLAELSRQAQIDCDLSCVFTPQEIASLLLTLASGLATRWSLGGRTFDLATESRRLLEILLHGMHGAC